MGLNTANSRVLRCRTEVHGNGSSHFGFRLMSCLEVKTVRGSLFVEVETVRGSLFGYQKFKQDSPELASALHEFEGKFNQK